MTYDNYSHQSGRLRAIIRCKLHDIPGALCRKDVCVGSFPSNERAESYLIAWLYHGHKEPLRSMNLTFHIDSEPPDDLVDEVHRERFGEG